MTPIRFQAADGFELAGTLYGDAAGTKAAVLIACHRQICACALRTVHFGFLRHATGSTCR